MRTSIPAVHTATPISRKTRAIRQSQAFPGTEADSFVLKAPRFAGQDYSNYGQKLKPYLALLDYVFGGVEWNKLKDSKVKKETADEIAAFLWKYIESSGMLSQPQKTAASIKTLEDSMREEGKPGIMRDTTLAVMQFLRENIDKPEEIQKGLHLLVEVLLSGGYKKLKKIVQLLSSGRFAATPHNAQGQLLVEAMGPVWVKALQTLSTVPGMFSPHIQKSLEPLYEKGTPVPFEQIRRIVESELKIPLEVAFPWFNPVPIKTGSIAQIHEALLPGGERVAVKIVKDEVAETLDEDLEMLQPFAEMMQQLVPKFDARNFLGEFFDLMKKECDMVLEGEKLKQADATFKENDKIQVPKVYDSHTTPRILTMEFLDTETLLNFKGKKSIAGQYLSTLLDQVFVYGLCQADPHPANMPYSETKKRFGFLDAGLAYQIPKEERNTFAKMLVAIYAKDSSLFTEAVLKNVQQSKSESLAAFQRFLKMEMARIDFEKPETILAFLGQVEYQTRKQDIQTDPVNPLLWKTLLTGIGVAKTLYPQINLPLILGRKLVLHLLKENRTFLWMASQVLLKQQYETVLNQLKSIRK